jgi:hydrogenase nickel incorporation protein HypA/HybF
MHEYSLVLALVDRVEVEVRKQGAIAVHAVHVQLGEQAGVDPELLATAFDTFKAGTVCEKAALLLARVPARWACVQCKWPIAAGERLQCPACGQPAYLVEGNELVLQRLELEVP